MMKHMLWLSVLLLCCGSAVVQKLPALTVGDYAISALLCSVVLFVLLAFCCWWLRERCFGVLEGLGHRFVWMGSCAVRMLCMIALAMVLPCSCIEEEMKEDVVMIGDRLPDFSVQMSDGTVLTGAVLRSTSSVVMFFHTSCPDCRQALPHVQRLYDEYSNRVQFALISREENAASVEAYWGRNGLTMPYSAQENCQVYELFAYTRVPRIYVNDTMGVVRYIFTDSPTPTNDVLSEAIKAVLE